jgi:hypothetical protein
LCLLFETRLESGGLSGLKKFSSRLLDDCHSFSFSPCYRKIGDRLQKTRHMFAPGRQLGTRAIGHGATLLL